MNSFRRKGSARKTVKELDKLLSKNDKASARKIISRLAFGDIAKLLELTRRKMAIFRMLSPDVQAEVLFSVGIGVRKSIVRSLSQAEIDAILHYTDKTEEEVILKHREGLDKTEEVERLEAEYAENIAEITQLMPEAADLIKRNFVMARENYTVSDVAKKVEEYFRSGASDVPIILATDGKGKLLGRVYFAHIIAAGGDEPIDHLISDALFVGSDFEKERLVHLLKKNPKHDLIVVIDEDKVPIGVVEARDLMRVVEEEATKRLLKFAGVHKEESATDSVSATVKHRLKWLVVNLLTSLGAVAIISLFQDTLSEMVILAAYMPIVASMGGNAGTQTLAVVVRSLALGEIEPGIGKKIALKEMAAGILNGAANGIIIAAIAYALNRDVMLGVVLAVAMILNLLAAGLFGTIIPLTLKRFNVDPAVSSAVLLTTVTDIVGFLAFLGLASAVLM